MEKANRVGTDWLTVIVLSALAYLIGTFLHEIAGHGAACALLGGRLLELGAFYVNCDNSSLSDAGIRVVAVAGPLLSLLTGIVAYFILERLPDTAFHARFFFWLLGTFGLMVATGYLLFSGITGLGDFGTSRDGLLYGWSPEWLWRVLSAVLGLAGYLLVVRVSLRWMDRIIGGKGEERVGRAQMLALVAYLSGGVASILIGLLNPLGIVILLISAAAASLGGTSALLWMMQLLDRKKESPAPVLQISRNWPIIGVGLVLIVAYALILGPTLHP